MKKLLTDIRLRCGETLDTSLERFIKYPSEVCQSLIRMLLHSRNIKLLLVLDNVEEIADIACFGYLGMTTLITSRKAFALSDDKTIQIPNLLIDPKDQRNFLAAYAKKVQDASAIFSIPINELKLVLDAEVLRRMLAGQGDMRQIFLESLTEIERTRMMYLSLLKDNKPFSVELLKNLWNLDSNSVQDQAREFISMGAALVGYDPDTLQLREDLYDLFRERLLESNSSSYKTALDRMKNYLKSKSSFKDPQFNESLLLEMCNCWAHLMPQEEDFKQYWQAIDEVIAIGNSSEEFAYAENILMLLVKLRDEYSDRAKRSLLTIYSRKLAKFGHSVEIVSTLNKYLYLEIDDSVIDSYFREIFASCGQSNSSIYPQVLSNGLSRFFSSGLYSKMTEVMLIVISSTEFDANKYLPIPALFLINYINCLIASGNGREAGKLASKLHEECPKVPFYSLVALHFKDILAETYELKQKFNKTRCLRIELLDECVSKYGHYHPLSIAATEKLCSLCIKLSSWETLEPLLLQLLRCQGRVYGENSRASISTALKVSTSYKNRREIQKAIDFLKTELNIRRAHDHFSDIDLLLLMDELGNLCLSANLLKDASNIFKRICAIINEDSIAPLSPDTSLMKARALFHVGSSFFLSKKLEKAKENYIESLNVLHVIISHFGETALAEDLGRAFMCLGEVFYNSDDYVSAIENFDKSLLYLQTQHKEDDPMIMEIVRCKELAEKSLDAARFSSQSQVSLSVDPINETIQEFVEPTIETDDPRRVETLRSEIPANNFSRAANNFDQQQVATFDGYDSSEEHEFVDAFEFPLDRVSEQINAYEAVSGSGGIDFEDAPDDILLVSSKDKVDIPASEDKTHCVLAPSVEDNGVHKKGEGSYLANISSAAKDLHEKVDVVINMKQDIRGSHKDVHVDLSTRCDQIVDQDFLPEVPRYNSTTNFDIFYYCEHRIPQDQISFDSEFDLASILSCDQFPLFVYNEYRQNCSGHSQILRVDGIEYVYTASTCDLFSMYLDKSTNRIVAIRPNECTSKYMTGRSISQAAQAVGEVYLCQRENVSLFDKLYGLDFIKSPVKVR